MSPDELEEANWRLANPPTIDVSVSRRMGLFVVGRLAQRHGIRVELRAALSGGLTAFVILAPNALMQDTGTVRPQRIDSLPGPSADRAPVQSPIVRGEITRPERDRPAPVPDTPREPVRSHGMPLPKRKSVALLAPAGCAALRQVGRAAAEPAAGAAAASAGPPAAAPVRGPGVRREPLSDREQRAFPYLRGNAVGMVPAA
jgi:hypothetical protein